MKRKFWFLLFVPVFFSGCGNIEWFPDNSAVFTNNSTNRIATTNPVTTPSPPSLTKSFSPAAILAGTDSILTFTIINGTGAPALSGLGFTDTLPTGLTVATAAASQCGGIVSISGSQLIFISGSLGAGPAICSIAATVNGATAGSFTIKTIDITDLTGGLLNGVTDQTLKVYDLPTSVTLGDVTASNVLQVSSDANPPNVDYTLSVDAANNSAANDANITVAVIAVDINGADIPSTATNISGTVFSGTTTAEFFGFGSPLVPVPIADAARIQFWRIVTVQKTI